MLYPLSYEGWQPTNLAEGPVGHTGVNPSPCDRPTRRAIAP